MTGAEIHAGKTQPMPLDVHRFIHLGGDGWMEQQPGGGISPGRDRIIAAFLGAEVVLELLGN